MRFPPPHFWDASPEHCVEQSEDVAALPVEGFVEVTTLLPAKSTKCRDQGMKVKQSSAMRTEAVRQSENALTTVAFLACRYL